MAAAAMTSRVLLPFQAPQWHLCQSRRGMATLKELAVRLKSVKNIQKITKSMKMVSASKFARAERDLKQARVFGKGALSLYEKAGIAPEEKKPNHLIVAVSSDRGLCGGIHSNIAKNIKATIAAHQPSGDKITVVCVGDKVRTILQRTHSSKILMGFSELGKKPPTFKEASHVAQEVLNSGVEFESAEIVYNRFKTVISYNTTQQPVVPLTTLIDSEKMSIYDDLDTHVLQCYHEIALANLIFYAMKEGATSEQSSRMTAMDSASKNAGEMIDKLTLTYNRTRQAVITRELIEIISGAAAIA